MYMLKSTIKSIWLYIFNILVWLDQGVNTLTGGDPDHTISGRVGYNSTLGKPWAIKLEKIINTIFFWQPNHCFLSIEWLVVRRKLNKERRNLREDTKNN